MTKKEETLDKYEKKIKEIEEKLNINTQPQENQEKTPKKLPFFQRLAIKRWLKKLQKRKLNKTKQETRKNLILAILSGKDLFDLYDDETGEELDYNILLTKTTKELEKLFKDLLKELQLIVNGK